MTLDELRALAEPAEGGVHRFPPPYQKMAVTLEEGEFLYALVRMLKPTFVLELGTGLGVSAKFIEGALDVNRTGALASVEPDEELGCAAIEALGLESAIWSKEPTGIEPDIVFIDSGYKTRRTDIASWLSGTYPGIVVVHDAGRGYEELALGRGVLLPSPDGMWIGRAGA